MIVLVTGGRNYSDRDRVFSTLDKLHAETPITCIVAGEQTGADTYALKWANAKPVPWLRYPADWDHYGKSAGPRRNRKMLKEGKPDLVVAFPGGDGTADMVNQATKAGVRVLTITDGGES